MMFTIISALSAPLMVINAGCHYLTWPESGLGEEEIKRAAKIHSYANLVLSASVFTAGVAAAVYVATRLQETTPLIQFAMKLRIVAMTTIALSIYVAGAVVNRVCEDRLRNQK